MLSKSYCAERLPSSGFMATIRACSHGRIGRRSARVKMRKATLRLPAGTALFLDVGVLEAEQE